MVGRAPRLLEHGEPRLQLRDGLGPPRAPVQPLRRRVLHALEDPHEQHVGGQLLDFGRHQDAALGTSQLLVSLDDVFQALPAERVLTGQHLAGGVEALQAHGALEEVVEGALVHGDAQAGVIASGRDRCGGGSGRDAADNGKTHNNREFDGSPHAECKRLKLDAEAGARCQLPM